MRNDIGYNSKFVPHELSAAILFPRLLPAGSQEHGSAWLVLVDEDAKISSRGSSYLDTVTLYLALY